MTCEICKSNYNNDLSKCPYCGLNNPEYGAQKCFKCGEEMDPGERFCAKCGSLQAAPPKCSSCNAPLKPNAGFCTQCGTPVPSAAAEPLPPVPQAPKAAPSPEEKPSTIPEDTAAETFAEPKEPVIAEPQVSHSSASNIKPIISISTDVTQKASTAGSLPDSRPSVQRSAAEHSAAPRNEGGMTGSNKSIVNPAPLPVNVPAPKPAKAPASPQPESVSSTAGSVDYSFTPTSKKSAIMDSDLQVSPPPPRVPQEEVSFIDSLSMDMDDEKNSLSIHDQLFSEQNAASDNSFSPQMPTKTIRKARRKGNPLLLVLLILLILIILGALAFIWFRLIPNSLSANVSSTLKASSKVIASEQIDSAESPETQEVVASAATPASFAYKSVEIIKPEWDEVSSFDEDGIAKVRKGTLWGIIDKQGNKLSEIEYDSISQFSEGFSPVKSGDSYSYINTEGSNVFPFKFKSATEFSEGRALVFHENKYQYLTAEGKFLDYGGQLSTPFSEGVAAVLALEGSYFINFDGEKLSGEYDEAGRFSENLAPVRMNTSWGYVDHDFELVIDYSYEEAGSFMDGVAIVKKDGKKFLIDQTGTPRSPAVDEIWQFKGDFATVRNSDLFGFVDGKSTEYLIAPQYSDVYAFSQNKAAVNMNPGIWYYVDSKNQALFDKQFEEAYRFSDDLACVKIATGYTLIDSAGGQAVSDSWEQVGVFSQNILPVMKDSKWGFVEIVPNK